MRYLAIVYDYMVLHTVSIRQGALLMHYVWHSGVAESFVQHELKSSATLALRSHSCCFISYTV